MASRLLHIIAVLPVMVVTISSDVCTAAEFNIEPSLILSEEYNDNILLDDKDEIEEYITRVQIGLALDYESSRLLLDILYAPEYRYFANYNDYPEQSVKDEVVHYIHSRGQAELMRNFLFFEVRDVYERVSLDTTRDFTEESLFVNQSDRNTLILNPYFNLQLTDLLTIKPGYRYIDIWYREDEGIDKYSNIYYADLEYALSQTVVLSAGYQYIQENNETRDQDINDADDFDRHDVYVGGRYIYAEDSDLFVRVGYSDVDFDQGENYDYIYWNVRLYHQFTSFYTALETARDFSENPTGDPQRVDRYSLLIGNQSIQESPDSVDARDLKRTTFDLLAYFNEFTDTETEDLETQTYGATGSLGYLFSERLRGTINVRAQKEEDKDLDTYTRLYLGGVSVQYFLPHDSNLSLTYGYTDSYSPEIEDDNYENNRVIFEISKTF